MQLNQTLEPIKEKKTRRRLRLSCVECTKRRQKCDRKYPCSLCTQRGVTHLCRWEKVPVARPTPARPPIGFSNTSSEETIELLHAKIASLEKALAEKTNDKTITRAKIEPIADLVLPTSPASSSTVGASIENASPYPSPVPDLPTMHPSPSTKLREDDIELPPEPLTYLRPMVYNTTSALASLSFGHHGEYIGRGSLICALHAISTGETSRFLYAKSTDSTSVYRDMNPGTIRNLLIVRVEDLIRDIPSAAAATALLDTFFAECNWRFGIPEEWFRKACSQMWNVLGYPGPHGLLVNANWLSLLFAVLAYTPRQGKLEGPAVQAETRDYYFSCAMRARLVAEEDYMNKPNISLMVSAADGTVLLCLAVPILCSYLSEHGHVSEAWKLVGNGIRQAEAVGMHRDPEWRHWQVMSKDEVLLRRRAWWGLYIWDKMYSYLLGRPQMLRKETFDVAAPSSIEPDGMRSVFCLGQSTWIQLCAIAEAALDNCFSVAFPDFATFFHMDNRFEHWEQNLPPEYQLSRHEDAVNDLTQTELTSIDRQRYNLHTWYLLCRMKLYIAALTRVRRYRIFRKDVLDIGKAAILISTRLIKLQCDTFDSALGYGTENTDPTFPGSIWFFEGYFSLFEAAVALITTLTRNPWTDKMSEAEQLVDRAMGILVQVAQHRESARMAVEVLASLRQESWWRAHTSDTSAASNVLPPFHPTELAPNYSMPTESTFGYDEYFASMTYSNLFRFPGTSNQVTSQLTVPSVSIMSTMEAGE